MRSIILMIAATLLCACAAQDVSEESLRLETAAEMECARQCEYIHGGTVRGCRGAEAGATREIGLIEECIASSYAELRNCYVACDLGGK